MVGFALTPGISVVMLGSHDNSGCKCFFHSGFTSDKCRVTSLHDLWPYWHTFRNAFSMQVYVTCMLWHEKEKEEEAAEGFVLLGSAKCTCLVLSPQLCCLGKPLH